MQRNCKSDSAFSFILFLTNNKSAASSESEEPAVASNGVHNAMY